jgi:hypothetical protein
MMLKRIIILYLTVLPLAIFAQENNGYFGNEPFLDSDSTNVKSETPAPIKENKLEAGFSAGSMFTNYYGNSVFTNYAAPEIRYNFTDKFTLSAGTMMTYSSFPTYTQWNGENATQANRSMMNYYMFMKGSYLITDNLRVHGSAVFDMSPNASSRNTFNTLGFDYKIGENTYISAEVSIYNVSNQNPFFRPQYSAFDDNPAIRPFGNSLFSEPFPSW